MEEFMPFPGDTYESPEREVSLLGRLLPSWVFYAKMIKLYWLAGRRAQKGGYDGRMWIGDSYTAVENMHSVGGRFHITGMDRIRRTEGPCVFAANHMSTMETIILPSIIQPIKDATFVTKRSLFKYPCFRDILAAREPVVVSRTNPRADLKLVFEEGGARLAAGRSIIIFPQGTRHMVFDPKQFNSLAVKLARKAGVPVIPIALHTAAWGEGRWLHDFGYIRPDIPIRFSFGEPIDANDDKEAQAAVIRFIGGTLREWDPGLVRS